ncbi:hypothetical protein AB0I28_38740 [Phytomonospora sp. NPDC050363]|uniref:hypothetical protein n=1 Tax=Phytomonospora sp. NPDC050363 TaxID=3155642 RepID=UPI0033D4D70D
MARNAWGTAVVTAFGTAAVIGTAQLGVAYGLTMMDWRDDTAGIWSTNMAWTTWLAAVSTVLGALAANVVAAAKEAQTVVVRLSSALAAGLGAGLIAPLVALPARDSAQAAVSGTPFLAVGIGIAAGLALALIAMAAPPVAWSMYASTALVWLLALLSVAVPVGDKDLPVQLGVWGTWADMTGALGKRGFALAPPLLIGSLLIGVIVALIASWNGQGQGVAAASGVVGPLLVTVAYLVAGPGTGTTVDSLSAFLVGPYAAIVGLIGSLVVALLRREKPSASTRTPVTESAESEPPLPRRDDEDAVYERIPATRSTPDPYVDEYTKALDQVDGAFADDKPQPARKGEDKPPPFPPPFPPPADDPPKKPDETEDWVTGLREEETPPPPKKRAPRRKN